MTSIRLKIEESWYASLDCKVQKSGPWVCFHGGHLTGYKLGNHPKNIEPCAHVARTVRQRPLDSNLCVAGVFVPMAAAASAEEVKQLYLTEFEPMKYYETYYGAVTPFQTFYLDNLHEFYTQDAPNIDPSAGTRLLDIGCGGNVLFELSASG